MHIKQYTVRNIPPQVDRYLRARARLSGKSLNKTIINELSEKAGISKKGVIKSLDWFIGSNTMDKATLKAIEDSDKTQKKYVSKEMGLDS